MSRHLMARFRHLATSSAFPWRPDDREWVYGDYGLYHPNTEAYHAPLENGHRLKVWDDSITESRWGALDEQGFRLGELPPEKPGSHWKGGWDEGEDFPNDPDMPGYPNNQHPHWEAVYDENSPLRAKAYPSREQAMRAVEQRYRQKYPLGTSTGSHDSGVDYDINDIMRRFDRGEL